MIIEKNISLLPYNTFHINASASLFANINNLEDAQEIVQQKLPEKYATLLLGGGSNVLLTKNFDGLVLKNNLLGKEIVKETDEHVFVKARSGEVWHEFVLFCIAKNYGGLENLSLIPGSVGASPIQNIGAYGAEIKDTFYELEALHLHEGYTKTFSLTECNFGYRESVFKHDLKGQYLITSVTFKLSKNPKFRTDYGQIQTELEKMKVTELSVKAISDAVCSIRRSKLPDPAQIGNAGSFFKNPVISNEQYNELKVQFPDISAYPAEKNTKIAAGWLIEKAGWKGKTFENYGVHKNQALVLVNYGGATGEQIYNLSSEIISSIQKMFGITLEREVNMI
ncbi:MAG: UDP-N-acetylmuramate dehydrogenase [Bacteroidetes bacterium]|nr:UDP-N-acetylmuramate dehydrogenase [Bacteroidota bacterium]